MKTVPQEETANQEEITAAKGDMHMPTIDDILTSLFQMAKENPDLRRRMLETAEQENPVGELCKISTELGYPMYEMDLISAGEDYYAAMRRSTNGGGENSPLLTYSDDYYELFLTRLRDL